MNNETAMGAIAGFVGDFTVGVPITLVAGGVANFVPKEKNWKDMGKGMLIGSVVGLLAKLVVVHAVTQVQTPTEASAKSTVIPVKKPEVQHTLII